MPCDCPGQIKFNLGPELRLSRLKNYGRSSNSAKDCISCYCAKLSQRRRMNKANVDMCHQMCEAFRVKDDTSSDSMLRTIFNVDDKQNVPVCSQLAAERPANTDYKQNYVRSDETLNIAKPGEVSIFNDFAQLGQFFGEIFRGYFRAMQVFWMARRRLKIVIMVIMAIILFLILKRKYPSSGINDVNESDLPTEAVSSMPVSNILPEESTISQSEPAVEPGSLDDVSTNERKLRNPLDCNSPMRGNKGENKDRNIKCASCTIYNNCPAE